MVDCRDYKKGRCLGNCDGIGHFQCDECKWRKGMTRVQNEINWEQRRYEIAKDLYIQTCQQAKLEGDNTAGDVFRSVAWLSRVAAD